MSVSGIGRCQWVRAIFMDLYSVLAGTFSQCGLRQYVGIFNARFPKVFFCISKSIVFLSLKIDLDIAKKKKKKKRKLMKESILRHYI